MGHVVGFPASRKFGVAPITLRFYMPSTGAADVSPTFGGGWADTALGDRRKCVTTRISSAMTDTIFTTIAGTSAQFVLRRQYVSAPLQAGTLSGTIKGQVRASGSGTNSTLAVGIFVVSNDGSTVRGTALANTASQLTTTPPRFAGSSVKTNRQMLDASDSASIALSTVTVQSGDRLVIEIGVRELAGGGINGTLVFGDNSGTDLPEENSTSATNNPWIEFSSCPPLQ